MDPFTIASLGGAAIKAGAGFFGAKDAEEKALEAARQAQLAYDQGNKAAVKTTNQSAGRQQGYIKPYAQQGGAANTQYNDAIGVNGQPKQAAFFSSFQNDPGYQATLDAGQQQVEHSAIFQGRANSGGTQKELFEHGQRQQYSQFQDRLNRLQGAGAQGFDAARGQATIEGNRGSSIADLALQRGQFAANSQNNQGQIRADAAGQKWGALGSFGGDLASTYGRTAGMGGKTGGSFFG